MRLALLALLLFTGTADALPLRNRAFRGNRVSAIPAPRKASVVALPTVKQSLTVPPRPAALTDFMVRQINRTPPSRMPSLCRYVPASAAPVLDQIIRDGQVDACARAWGLELGAARAFAVAWINYRSLPVPKR